MIEPTQAGSPATIAAGVTTVGAALATAAAAGISRLDSHLLLADLLDCRRTWLLVHDDALLDELQTVAWADRVRRRSDAEPLAYILQRKEFFGLMLRVSPSVLVPRPDTETLVTWALEIINQDSKLTESSRLVDLGTGSGAIALALKKTRPDIEVCAVEASEAALDVARHNGQHLGLDVKWCVGDWWAGAGDGLFDLAVSNPPYISEGDPHLPALRHEPKLALVAADDGMAALKAIIQGAEPHLRAGAWLLLEHGYQQSTAVAALLAQAGFVGVQTRADLAGQPRCTAGQWPGRET
nr:putative peptide chain release factor N(5)-glutamine methyltransferase [uncultured bacterium]